ncbi:MAG TPA: carbohydrate ABC transporter permease [Planctomycetota bacterium]|jgi:multiple sugar transport system permease protein
MASFRQRFSFRKLLGKDPDDMASGYGGKVGSQNVVTAGALHIILLAISSLFLLPLIWMAVTSLKPLDQTMTLPPTWVPRATLATLDGKSMLVNKEKKLTEPHVIIIQQGGHEKGKRKLLAKSALLTEGGVTKANVKYSFAGRELVEPEPVPVEVVKECPIGDWHIIEWLPDYSAEREKSQKEPLWDVVPEASISTTPHLFTSNYSAALGRMDFVRYLLNTLFVCFMTVLGVVVSCTLVAYAFAFLDFPGRNWLFAATLAVMMVPFPATMVPLFDVFRSFGWIGTYKPLWVPAWFGGAFFIFLLRQFFLGLPKDLLDAARIDGCTEIEILWHVVVPLARPALAMVALFQFMGSWKDFMGPMLYMTNKSQFTLSVGLQALQSQHGGTPWHILMAASMMFSLPLIVLFLVARKTFMRGIAMTGIKG